MKKPKWLSQNIRLFKCAASCANKAGNTALQTCVFSGNANFQVPSICGAILSSPFSSRKCNWMFSRSTANAFLHIRCTRQNWFFAFGIILSCSFVHRATMSFEMYRMFFQMTAITFAQKTEVINADCRMTILVSFRWHTLFFLVLRFLIFVFCFSGVFSS